MVWYPDGVPEVFESSPNSVCRSCGDCQYGIVDKTGICWECWDLIRDGVVSERQRIIKLLEGLMNFETNTQRRIDHKLALEVLKNTLIKGEN